MGEFFKEEKHEDVKKEVELITDFSALCAAFDALMVKINETTTQGYEAILPIRTELTGARATPDDIGQVGTIRRMIESSRIYRMDLGMQMYNALKNIEDLDKWSERYIRYMEEHQDSLELIAKSGFKIIADLQQEIKKLNVEIHQLNDKIIIQPGLPPVQIEEDPKLDVFKTMFDDRKRKYMSAKKIGDEKTIETAKRQFLAVAGNDKEHKILVEKEIVKIDKKK